jgi:hypothetical protein
MFALETCLGFVFCSVVILDWKNVYMWVLCVLTKSLKKNLGKICIFVENLVHFEMDFNSFSHSSGYP